MQSTKKRWYSLRINVGYIQNYITVTYSDVNMQRLNYKTKGEQTIVRGRLPRRVPKTMLTR